MINKCKIKYKFSKRREGEFTSIDNSLILSTLNWKNKRDIRDMCMDSWKWKKINPKGYKY